DLLFQRFPLYDVAGWTIYVPEIILASAFILAFAWLNWKGSELSGRFQLWAVILLIAAVVIIFVSLLVHYFAVQPELPAAIPTGRSVTAAILPLCAFAT